MDAVRTACWSLLSLSVKRPSRHDAISATVAPVVRERQQRTNAASRLTLSLHEPTAAACPAQDSAFLTLSLSLRLLLERLPLLPNERRPSSAEEGEEKRAHKGRGRRKRE